MKTKVLRLVARLCGLMMLLLIVQSCVRFDVAHPRSNGHAYVRLNWNEEEPSYIDVDGLVPSNFYWNRYYSTLPGYYSVYYEYEWSDRRGVHYDAYTAKVNVWVNYGSTSNYSSYNGADNYFDLDLYPDGYSDFRLKSGSETSGSTLDSTVFKNIVLAKGNTTIEVFYSRVTPREHK